MLNINSYQLLSTMRPVFILLVLLANALSVSDKDFTLVKLPTNSGAMCLDGSPAGFYYRPGSGDNKNKFLIYFHGGGFCEGITLSETIEACYQRSFTSFGSTANISDTRSFEGKGVLSPNQDQNPLFYDWTKIYVIYCDGSQHSGTLDDPIVYKDRKLYFRGYNNSIAQFQYFDEHFDFYNGEKIVITGVSAGGIATFLYSNYVLENTKKAKVYSMPDSGLFLTEFYSPIVGMQVVRVQAENLFKLIHQDNDRGFPIKECFEEFPGEYYRCYNAANLAKYEKAPTFVIESPYDHWSLSYLVVSGCVAKKQPANLTDCNDSTRAVIETYRKETVNAFYEMRAVKKDVSLWAPSCVQHGFSDRPSLTDPKYIIQSAHSLTLNDAIKEFLDNPTQPKWYLQEVPWPYHQGCNGLQSQFTRKNLIEQ